MKTYFKKDIMSFCLDDEDQSYTQVNIGYTEKVIVRGTNPKVYESLMMAMEESDALSEEEFNSKKTQVLSDLSN